MEAILTALSKIGGFAVIGGLLDFAIRKSEKEKFEHFMIVWWDRFDSVRWYNFGQRESILAIRVLDRFAGARLFSWRRLAFVLAVGAMTVVVSVALTIWTMSAAASKAPGPYGAVWPYAVRAIDEQTSLATIFAAMGAFAVALSLTRFISNGAARIPTGTVSGILTYGGLLVVHLVLFAIWTVAVVHLIVFAAQPLVLSLIAGGSLEPMLYFVKLKIASFTLEGHWRDVAQMWSLAPWDWTITDLNKRPGPGTFAYHTSSVLIGNIERVFDFASYGLRIGFALLFLSSYLFRSLIQEPITRLWAGVIDSRRLTFTMIFGAVGAVVVFMHSLMTA